MMFRKLLIASSVIYANADATSDFIAGLPWPVDIVTPKSDFVGLEENQPAPWCNIGLMEALSKALYLNEVPPTTTPPQGRNTLQKMDRLFRVVDDIFTIRDGREKVPVAGALPVYDDANAQPAAKIRSLITTITIASRMNPAHLDAILDAHESLEDSREERLSYVKALVQNTHFEEPSRVSQLIAQVKEAFVGVEPEPLLDISLPSSMDEVPDTLVGFLSSRVVTEVLAELATDNWLSGLTHDATNGNLGEALCRGVDTGMKIDYLPDITACSLITLVVNLMVCSTVTSRTDCSNPAVPQYELDTCDLFSEKTVAAPVKQLTFQPVEESVQDHHLTESAVQNEGETLYMLQYANMQNDNRSTQSWCQVTDGLVSEHLPGWPIVKEVWLNQENDGTGENAPTKYAPFATMSKRNKLETDAVGRCEFIIANRGSATGWEWYMNLHLGLAPLPGVSDPQLKAHSQYANISRRVIDSFNEMLLNKHFYAEPSSDDFCDPNATTLWFVGHSLGGGMANVQSFMAAYEWKVRRGFEKMQVNTLALASMRVFNEKANKLYAELVNQRNFRFQYDLVPSMGCPNVGIPRCDSKMYPASIVGEGRDEPEPELPGSVVLNGKRDFADVDADMAFFNDKAFTFVPIDALLSNLGALYINIPTSLQLGIGHVCSYRCFLSSNFCSKDKTKQLNCVRDGLFTDKEGDVPYDQSSYCFKKFGGQGDVDKYTNYWGDGNQWLGSLNCDKNPKKLGLPIHGNHICSNILSGMNYASLMSIM